MPAPAKTPPVTKSALIALDAAFVKVLEESDKQIQQFTREIQGAKVGFAALKLPFLLTALQMANSNKSQAMAYRWLISIESRLLELQNPKNDVPDSVKLVLAGFQLDLSELQLAVTGIRNEVETLGGIQGTANARMDAHLREEPEAHEGKR